MAEQIFAFFCVGVLLAVLYDIFTFFRCLLPTKVCCFIIDFIYFVPAAVITFIFLLSYNNGQSRAIYYAAIFCGFILYILTFYRLTFRLWKKLAQIIRTAVLFICKIIKKLLQSLSKLYYNIKKIFLPKINIRALPVVKNFARRAQRQNKKSKAGSSNERKCQKAKGKFQKKQ